MELLIKASSGFTYFVSARFEPMEDSSTAFEWQASKIYKFHAVEFFNIGLIS